MILAISAVRPRRRGGGERLEPRLARQLLIAFAIVQAFSSFQSGIPVNRIGAVRPLPFYLAPMAGGLLVLALFSRWRRSSI